MAVFNMTGGGSSGGGGTDTSDATAYAENIEAGYTAYARGLKLTGTRVIRYATIKVDRVSANTVYLTSDTTLKPTIALTDLLLTNATAATFTYVNQNLIKLELQDVPTSTLTCQFLATAFVNEVGSSDTISFTPATNLSQFYGSLVNNHDHAYTNDDGATTVTLPAAGSGWDASNPRPAAWRWPIASAAMTAFTLSGNSFINHNSGTENIKFNRRDTYVSTFYTYWDAADGVTFLKITWKGWTPYSTRTDPYLYTWELYLLDTGDASIHLASKGASAVFDGTFTFFGATYTIDTTDDTVTFYRRSLSGANATDWEVVHGNFDKAQSSHLLD